MKMSTYRCTKSALLASILLIVISVTETAFKTERIFYPLCIIPLAFLWARYGFKLKKNYSGAILLFMIYSVITCLWSPSSSALRNCFVKIAVILFLYLQLQFEYSEEYLEKIKNAFVWQLVALFVMLIVFGHIDWDGRLWIIRGSESTDPNSLCSWLIIPIPILMEYIFKGGKKILVKALYCLFLVGIVAVSLMSGSRSGIIAVAFTILLCFGYIFKESVWNNPKVAVFVVFTGIIITVMVIHYMPETVINRFLYGNTANLGGRTSRWLDLLSTLSEHPLGIVFGMGECSTVYYSSYSVVAHNLYIEILFSQGLIGLSLLIVFIGSLIKNSYKVNPFGMIALLGILLMSATLSEFTSRGVMLSFFYAGMCITPYEKNGFEKV